MKLRALMHWWNILGKNKQRKVFPKNPLETQPLPHNNVTNKFNNIYSQAMPTYLQKLDHSTMVSHNFFNLWEKKSIKITMPSPSSDSPMLGVYHNGTRVTHLSLNESLAGLWSLLQPGNTDSLLRPIICPVEITSHPVYRYPLYCVDTWDKKKKPRWKGSY